MVVVLVTQEDLVDQNSQVLDTLVLVVFVLSTVQELSLVVDQ